MCFGNLTACFVFWTLVSCCCCADFKQAIRHTGYMVAGLHVLYSSGSPMQAWYRCYHYENKPIQIYWKFYHPKNESFQMKNSMFFPISSQNIDCGYSLEPPQKGGSNEYPQSMFLSRNKKNNVYPCKPQFYYIKVGFKGSKLYRHVFVMQAPP